MRDLAIRNTHSTVVSINGDKDATDEQGNVVVLDETLISAEVSRLQAEYDSKQYARDRASAYPTLTEQADMAYWDRLNGTTTLDDAITAVKNKYPKG
tara:strand:- start:1167 stop:1457 length:291 start_codon:yes stop_codon:yes gene_type:complete